MHIYPTLEEKQQKFKCSASSFSLFEFSFPFWPKSRPKSMQIRMALMWLRVLAVDAALQSWGFW